MGMDPLTIGILAASAGLKVYNSAQTAKKQDRALATSIRNQAGKQRQADARVNDEITKLEGSTAENQRVKNLTAYTDALRKRAGEMTAGLTPAIGSAAFQSDAAGAVDGVKRYADDSAGLMARIDAPAYQRRDEATGYGKLATDIGIISREADGQAFLDKLRLDRIRENPWLNALADIGMGVAGSGMTGFGAGKAASGVSGIGAGIGKTAASFGKLTRIPNIIGPR